MVKSWHIIDTYKFAANTILCVCGWFGDAGNGIGDINSAWFIHRREMRDDPAPKGFNKKKYVYAPGLSQNGIRSLKSV